MSKTALRQYLSELKKKDLEYQIIDLYERFGQVKKYYDFVFNPKEEELIGEAKVKIANEYFPVKRKRAKARRSVAHRYIKQFKTLGMDPILLTDLMLFNMETAQRYSARHKVNEAFYKSMLRSFIEVVQHTAMHSLQEEYKDRIGDIYATALKQQWGFTDDFDRIFQINMTTDL